MPGKPAIAIADQFEALIKRLNWIRTKQERLLRKGLLARRDIEIVYEGLYMSLVTGLEQHLEELFVGMLWGRLDPPRGVHPRVRIPSPKVAREVVLGGKDYVDWLPYRHTEGRAQAFYRGGKPFTPLSKAEKQILRRVTAIRNVLAHRSAHSYRQYEEKILKALTLPPSLMQPARLLRSPSTLGPAPRTRYEEYATHMSGILRRLCT